MGHGPIQREGNIKPYSSKFDSYYDGLGVSYLQRPVPWGSIRISYTWSKAIDDVGEFFFSSPINNFNLLVDRSRSDDDQRHRVVFNAALNSPTSKAHSFAGHLTHGWQLSGILQYYSRLPFNITTGANTKQATSQRPCGARLQPDRNRRHEPLHRGASRRQSSAGTQASASTSSVSTLASVAPLRSPNA